MANASKRIHQACFFPLILLTIFLFASLAWAQPGGHASRPWQGTVNRVIDGDTLEVQRGRERVLVRMYGINAPEVRQPGGQEAVVEAKRLLLGKRVQISPMGSDRGRHMTALVYRGKMLVNSEMVRKGYAWVQTDSCHQQKICRDLQGLERDARKQRIGIWRKNNKHQPSWDWRDDNRHPGKGRDGHQPPPPPAQPPRWH